MTCLSGNCCAEITTLVGDGLPACWPDARPRIDHTFNRIKDLLCDSSCTKTVPPGTQRYQFRATVWPTGLPDPSLCPVLFVLEGCNIWMAPNAAGCDLGQTPAVIGTGVAWINIYVDNDQQIASAVPYTPGGAFSGLWPVAPTEVASALDQLAAFFAPSSGFLGAKVRYVGGLGNFSNDAQVTLLNTIDYNLSSLWSAGSQQFTVPAGQSGYYLIGAAMKVGNFNTAAVLHAGIKIRFNSESLSDFTLTPQFGVNDNWASYFLQGSIMRFLNVGDTVRLYTVLTGAGAQCYTDVNGAHFWIAKIK